MKKANEKMATQMELKNKLKPFLGDVVQRAEQYMTRPHKRIGSVVKDSDKAICLAWADVLLDIRRAWQYKRQKTWKTTTVAKTEEREARIELEEQPVADKPIGEEFMEILAPEVLEELK